MVYMIYPVYPKASMPAYYRHKIHTYRVQAYVGAEQDVAEVGIDLDHSDVKDIDPASGNEGLKIDMNVDVELQEGDTTFQEELHGLLGSLSCLLAFT